MYSTLNDSSRLLLLLLFYGPFEEEDVGFRVVDHVMNPAGCLNDTEGTPFAFLH